MAEVPGRWEPMTFATGIEQACCTCSESKHVVYYFHFIQVHRRGTIMAPILMEA